MSDEKSFSPGLQPVSLLDFVREAEQAQMFLQTELDYAHGERGEAAAQWELLLFYGWAFAQVVARIPGESSAEPWQEQILEEAVVGRTAYWEWQRRTTSLLAPPEWDRMRTHWRNVVVIATEAPA